MRKRIFNKKTVMAGVVILVLMVVSAYYVVRYAETQVKESLLEAVRPLQHACNESEGCFLIPPDWVERACPENSDLPGAEVCASPPQTSAYQGLVYRATADEFVARWRYVVDTELVVSGGRGRVLTVQELHLD